MKLTRRDAMAALAAAGVTAGGALSLSDSHGEGDPSNGGALNSGELRTLTSLAEVLYPEEVEEVESFVTEYTLSRIEDREGYAEATREALSYLDAYAESWHDAAFADLDPVTREKALRGMGADTADPDPNGDDTERVRYYLVNELLFALYASPTGGELVGIENPQGHPGGLASYQRGPDVAGGK
jgi:hypothetical protein